MLSRLRTLALDARARLHRSRARGTLLADGWFAARLMTSMARAAWRASEPHRATAPRTLGELRARAGAARQPASDAARLARREVEWSEAYRIYLRLEHSPVGYRAQAIVILKYLELEAEKVFQALPLRRQQELRRLAETLRAAALKTGEPTRGDPNCGECVRQLRPDLRGGDCCSGLVFMGFDELDAIFRVALGELAPVVREFPGDATRCGFLDGDGCRLTPGTRPTVCTAYYCQSYREDLQKRGRWDDLSDVLLAFNAARSQLAFKSKLARRFSGDVDVTRSVESHPVDFVWDRLRNRGATRSASQPRAESRLKIVE